MCNRMCPQLPPILPAVPARRRSDRVSITFPVEITGRDEAGEVFSERTTTSAVSRYGCGIRLPRTVRPNEELRIRRLDNGDREVGRVVARMNEHLTNVESDRHLYGVEMVKLCDEFWGIRFSSPMRGCRRRDGMACILWIVSEGLPTGARVRRAFQAMRRPTRRKILLQQHSGSRGRKRHALCAKGCPLVSVMVDGKPREVQMNMMHKDGHTWRSAVRAQAIFNSAGRIVGAVEMFHTHVTKARKLQR